MIDKPTEMRNFPNAEAILYAAVKADQFGVADRLIVQHYIGNRDEVLVFILKDERQIKRIRTVMSVGAPPFPGGPIGPCSFGEKLEEIGAENAKRLLTIYDLFGKRTFKSN